MFLNPQLCERIESLDDLELDRDSYVMQPKYDGWRCLAYIWQECGRNGVTFYSRQGNVLPASSDIEEELIKLFPTDTLLDAEIVGKDWGTVSSLMQRGKPITYEETLRANLRLMVFDVLRYRDNEARGVSWEIRNKIIQDTLTAYSANRVFPVPNSPIDQDFYDAAIAAGKEGVVIKKKSAFYRSGERDWYKLKPYQSDEMKVERIDVIDTGVTFYDYSGHKVYSPKAEAREVQPGDIIEVQHDGINESGNFRNPRFARIRNEFSTSAQ